MVNPRETNGYVQLREAIRKKDKEKARNLLLNNVSVNEPKARCTSLLHWAIIKFDDLEIITMLLDRSANIHAKNHKHEKPLDIAIEKNKTQVAILLIERGALFGEDLNALRRKAVRKNNQTIVRILEDNGKQYNSLDGLKIFFNDAICQGQLEKIKQLKHYYQYLKPSERYIPREAVTKPGQNYKECVEFLLNCNFTVNPISIVDGNFIYDAVEKGYLPIVLQLLKLEIDVDFLHAGTGLSLLEVACFNKHHDIVENLLKHHSSVNDTTPNFFRELRNLLYYRQNLYGLNHLLSPKYNKKDVCDITCLHIAVLNNDPIMTRLLLKYDAKIIDDPTFFNITCIAVRNNYEDIVSIFLDYGADVNDVDAQGKSLLHYCVNTDDNKQDSRISTAKLLLKRGATSQLQTPGNSLVFQAIKNKHPKTAQLFLDHNANIEYISPEGDTLLHKAIEKEFDVEFIENLLELDLPIDAVNNNMLTPLLVACMTESNDQLVIIERLLCYDANVNYTISQINTNCAAYQRNFPFLVVRGRTPLHMVCNYENDVTESIIELLLTYQANIEAVDAKGWTPLFVACYTANSIAVKCLLDHHANVNHTDLENLNLLYIAVKIRYVSEVVKILLDYGINVHFIDDQGKSIIHRIVENDHGKLIEYLADTQVNFNTVDKQGNTLLHIAVNYRFVDVMENLIKHGANINILDQKNRTPLKNAMENMYYSKDKYQGYCDEQYFYLEFGYSSVYFDQDEINQYESVMNEDAKIIKILKTQVVKLNTAQLKVSNKNLDMVYNSSSYNRYRFFNNDEGCRIDVSQLEEDCKREIEKMRTESIGVNNMTLYDLLRKNIHFLTRFVKNQKIQQTLELKVYDEKFPLYIDIVRSRFRDAKLQYKLVNSAKKYFNLNICPVLSDDCIDTVFSYLNVKEIKMFIGAMKPLNNEDKNQIKIRNGEFGRWGIWLRPTKN